jgi:trehalose synthase
VRHVDVAPLDLTRFAALLPAERIDMLRRTAERARTTLDGRVVWNVNATAQGGGVAEMLQVLLAYGRGEGVDTRWAVLDGDPEFFAVTKRLHNLLHGSPGDGGPLGDAEREHYDKVLAHNLTDLRAEVSPGDVVLLHDPQTAGLVHGLREVGAHVVWRCHIGRETGDEHTDLGWGFLRPDVEAAQATVWSRRQYPPPWVDQRTAWVIPPSVDPFTAKNVDLSARDVRAILLRSGILVNGGSRPPAGFPRRDGSAGEVRPHEGLLADGAPPPASARLVVQVSRWDRLKDMVGVLEGFARAERAGLDDDVHLVLAGPAVAGVSDDPEGAEVLAECQAAWEELPEDLRRRVHLAVLPMDDVDENAVLVNALQRHATVVVQKSLVEGFGLTVTEAMWKGSPVVASAVGGIQDQIADGVDGVLLADPTDLDAFASALAGLLADPERAARIGAAGRERVRAQFLGDRHLIQYVELFAGLLGEG